VWAGWDNVTLMNNIFAEPLNDSLHPKGAHGYTMVLGPVKGNVAVIGNLMAHTVSRNPLTTAANTVIVNNVVYNWASMAVDFQNQGGFATYNTVVGNVFVRGPQNGNFAPVLLRAATNKVADGSKVYLADNAADEATSDPWSIAAPFGASMDLTQFKAKTVSVWPAGLTRLDTTGNSTLNSVLRNAGARPADRDAVDSRVVQNVKSRNGQIINCVSADGSARCAKNAGGWPNMPVNHRALTLPANPNEVTASGYTNVELWLQQMSAEVEGRSGVPPTAPVLRTQAP
jgi:hypothetical protein